MDKIKQQIVLAEFYGYHLPKWKAGPFEEICEICGKSTQNHSIPPNYLKDLNALNELLQKLDEKQMVLFNKYLNNYDPTPEQYSEAILKSIDKWQD